MNCLPLIFKILPDTAPRRWPRGAGETAVSKVCRLHFSPLDAAACTGKGDLYLRQQLPKRLSNREPQGKDFRPLRRRQKPHVAPDLILA